MFQPETEDMLPRLAPKPSPDAPSGASDGIIRPQVPEVSILFGQNGNLQQQSFNVAAQQQENKVLPQQTYAAWKKQMLPKVNYPGSAEMADIHLREKDIMTQDYNNPNTNLYPMRTSPPFNMDSNVNLNGFLGNNCGVTNQLAYRRSLESSNKVYQRMQHLPILPPPQAPLRDALTICAGTQTDVILDSTCCLKHLPSGTLLSLASKKDVENIREILNEIKVEQERLLKMLEKMVNHSQITMKSHYQDIGIQVDIIGTEEPSNAIVSIRDSQPVLKNKFLQHLKPANNALQTPKGKPVAQSTTYRPNSPQFNFFQQQLIEVAPSPPNQQVFDIPMSVTPKSSSDTSLAMNELALKYLPNEKLTELLKELNMDCPLTTPDTNVPTTTADGLEKGFPDISKASFKYLKKYRLLPEDYEENVSNNAAIENQKQILPYHSPRNIATNPRLTPTNKCSPCVGRLPLSPPLQSTVSPQHIVNLENIKHQPKFL